MAEEQAGAQPVNAADRMKTEAGKTFKPPVLFVGGDGKADLAPKTAVTARVVEHVLGDKIRIGKYRPKSGYRKHTGFRASLTRIEIATRACGASAARAAAPHASIEPSAAISATALVSLVLVVIWIHPLRPDRQGLSIVFAARTSRFQAG